MGIVKEEVEEDEEEVTMRMKGVVVILVEKGNEVGVVMVMVVGGMRVVTMSQGWAYTGPQRSPDRGDEARTAVRRRD